MLAVRTLAERLLSLPHHSDAEAESVRVLAGALPDDLPCAVPIPEGVTVIGSVSYPPVQSAYDQRGRRVTILFDTALQPEEVMAYYGVLSGPAARRWMGRQIERRGDGARVGWRLSFRRSPQATGTLVSPQ
jgi:hypothetical protein